MYRDIYFWLYYSLAFSLASERNQLSPIWPLTSTTLKCDGFKNDLVPQFAYFVSLWFYL